MGKPGAASLPEDIRAALLEFASTYIRSAPVHDVPPSLRRFKGFRPKTMLRRAGELLALLDDDAQRKLMLQALDDGTLPLSKRTAAIARVALERAEGWEENLRAHSEEPAPDAGEESDPDLEEQLERERARAKRARDDARKARAEARAEIEGARRRTGELEREAESLRAEIARLTSESERARAEIEEITATSEQERRRSRRDLERERDRTEQLRAELKGARREVARLSRELRHLRREARPRPRPQRPVAEHPPPARRPLPVPKGLFAESPEALEIWLTEPHVSLLIDGYNVAMAEGGFGDLSLEYQRTRTIDEIDRLARSRRIPATIVFDGSVPSPGTSRRPRRGVGVAYSKPPETADDHLVALLEALPAYPVVVVTNDRELQERCEARGATIARAEQLLALIR